MMHILEEVDEIALNGNDDKKYNKSTQYNHMHMEQARTWYVKIKSSKIIM